MKKYCKYCEMEILEDFNEFACCDEEKIDRLEVENEKLEEVLDFIEDEDREGLNDDEDFRVMVMEHIRKYRERG